MKSNIKVCQVCNVYFPFMHRSSPTSHLYTYVNMDAFLPLCRLSYRNKMLLILELHKSRMIVLQELYNVKQKRWAVYSSRRVLQHVHIIHNSFCSVCMKLCHYISYHVCVNSTINLVGNKLYTFMLRTLASRWNKEGLDVFEQK